MKDVLMIPAIYQGSRDLSDKSKKLTFQTNEVTPAQAADLQIMVQQFCYLAIKPEPFLKDQIDLIQDLKTDFEDTGKTPAQRMRAVLYRNWQQQSEGYKDFNLYYAFKYEGIINHFKSKLI
jgi:hypothetical protein